MIKFLYGNGVYFKVAVNDVAVSLELADDLKECLMIGPSNPMMINLCCRNVCNFVYYLVFCDILHNFFTLQKSEFFAVTNRDRRVLEKLFRRTLENNTCGDERSSESSSTTFVETTD